MGRTYSREEKQRTTAEIKGIAYEKVGLEL